MDREMFNITDDLIETIMKDFHMGAEYIKSFIIDGYSVEERVALAENYTIKRKYQQYLGNIEKLYITLFTKMEVRNFTLEQIKRVSSKFYTNYINWALLTMSEEDRLSYIDFLFEVEKQEPLSIMSKRLSSFLKTTVRDVMSWLCDYKDYIRTKISTLYNRMIEEYGEDAAKKEFSYIVPYELMDAVHLTNEKQFYLLHYSKVKNEKERYTRSILLYNHDYCVSEMELEPKYLDCISIKEMERVLKNLYNNIDIEIDAPFMRTKTGNTMHQHINFALMVYSHYGEYEKVKILLNFLETISRNILLQSINSMPISFLCDMNILDLLEFDVLFELYNLSKTTKFQSTMYAFKLLMTMNKPPLIIRKLIVAADLS